MNNYNAWRELQVPAEKTYALLADWGETCWIPGPEKTEVSRAGSSITRHLFIGGAAPVQETLLSANSQTMTLQYTIAAGELFILQDYQGAIVVTPTGKGCRIDWSCSFAQGELTHEEAETIANRNLNFLLDSLCVYLEGSGLVGTVAENSRERTADQETEIMTKDVKGTDRAVAGDNDLGKSATNSPVEAAWERYQRAQNERRARFLNSEFVADSKIRAQGLYFLHSLETAAFNLYVAPRQQYPALYVQSIFMPLELSWGTPNPDFLNHNGFIDGSHSYRIYGNIRGIDWATIQIFKGFWGDEQQGTLANIDFDDVPVGADGSFEIFLGPNPPATADDRYWVQIDPQVRNMMLAMRETFYDWTRDEPMEIHIEMLDREPGSPIYFDEEELASRIDKSGKWAAACFELAMMGAKRLLGERNRFDEALGGRQQGGSPLGHWFMMVYDLQPDEALIVEMPVVAARYWGIQLASVWGQTTDYSYHQSSINSAQARLDADGRFRAVIALRDPGVPNWLDPAGLPLGSAVLRFYKADEVVAPTVTRVALGDLRKHLPPETPVVEAAQRHAQLDTRRAASLRRYGQ